MNYFLHLMILVELYVMLGLSLNLMVGYTGLLTLAHAAFYGIGAYVTALLMVNLHFGFLPATFVAVLVAVLLSTIVSLASLRFSGDYFIVATLAFQVLVFTVLYNWVNVTRGPFGISNIPKPAFGPIVIDSLPSFAVFGLIVTLLILGFLTLVFRAPFGRTIQAIRDDEIAAETLGKNVISFKMRTVALASGCAAIAGALYATYVTFIDPTSFTVGESILMLSMVIVGGTGNIKGPVVGAGLLILFPELLRFLSISSSAAANIRLIIYGTLLVVLMQFRPRGIAGTYEFQ